MSNESKNRLQTFVSDLDRSLEPKRGLIETTRLEIVKNAQNIVSAYEDHVSKVKPEAENALNTIIYPWWYEFRNSNLYQQLVSNISDHSLSFQLHVSEEISYYWPDRTIKELREMEPFAYIAKTMINGNRDQHIIDEAIGSYAIPSIQDNWTGHFIFSGLRNDYHKLSFKQWNKARECWAFSVGVQQLHITLDPRNNNQDIFENANPSVFVEFGKQIQDGRVWDVLEKSVKLKLSDE